MWEHEAHGLESYIERTNVVLSQSESRHQKLVLLSTTWVNDDISRQFTDGRLANSRV